MTEKFRKGDTLEQIRRKLARLNPGSGGTGSPGPTGPAGPPGAIIFDGGSASTNYAQAFNLDCGSAT